jgi:hypothetical protein
MLRSVSLAVLADGHGREAFDRHHEWVGFMAQVVALGLTALVFVVRRGKAEVNARAGTKGQPADETEEPVPFLPPLPRPRRVFGVPGWAFVGLALWIVALEGGRMMWFQWPDAEQEDVRWYFKAPSQLAHFREIHVPRGSYTTFGADQVFSGEWTEDPNRVRVVHFRQWSPRNPIDGSGRGHRPEICLAGKGLDIQGPPELVYFKVDHQELRFWRYRYVKERNTLDVYFGTWEASGRDLPLHSHWQLFRIDRLTRAWKGQGNPGHRVLEVGFWNTDEFAAHEEMRLLLRHAVSYKSTSGLAPAS